MSLLKKSYIESIDELLDELEQNIKRADQHDDANVQNYENTQKVDVENTGPRGKEDDQKTVSPANGPAAIKNAPKVDTDASHDAVKVEGTATSDENAEIRPKELGPNETINEKEAKKAFYAISDELLKMGQQLVQLIEARTASEFGQQKEAAQDDQAKQAADSGQPEGAQVNPEECPICAVINYAYETGSELAKSASAVPDDQVAEVIKSTIAEARAAARLTAQGIAEASEIIKQAMHEEAVGEVSPEEVAAALEALEAAEEPELEEAAEEVSGEEGVDEADLAAKLEELADVLSGGEAEEGEEEEVSPEEEALAEEVAKQAADILALRELLDFAKNAEDLEALAQLLGGDGDLEKQAGDELLELFGLDKEAGDDLENLLALAEANQLEKWAEDLYLQAITSEAAREAIRKAALEELAKHAVDALVEEAAEENPEAMEDEAIQEILDAVETLQEAQAMEEAAGEAEEASGELEEVKEALDREIRKKIARQFIEELVRRS